MMATQPQSPVRREGDAVASGEGAASAPRPSPFAHLSVARFSELLRTIDAASAAPLAAKRRRVDGSLPTAGGEGRRRARRLGTADWAKAKAAVRLETRAVVDPLRRATAAEATRGGGHLDSAAAATWSPSSSSSPSASSYAPFSKARLLQRIATYTLSSYSPRVAIAAKDTAAAPNEEAQETMASLVRWLEPLGPALSGWVHLSPHSSPPSAKQQPRGARNSLHCATCSSTLTVADHIDDAKTLLEHIQSLQRGHKAWCPWTKRACHHALYALRGPQEDFVGRLSRTKARRVFRELVASVDIAAVTDASLVHPADLTEEDLKALQAALVAHEKAVTAGNAADSPPPPPSLPAIQLALCGWLPSSPQASSSPTSSRSTALKPPACRPSLGSVLQCKSCSRKLTSSTLSRRMPIDPLREHRRFCPWVQGSVQNASYLPPLSAVLSAVTTTESVSLNKGEKAEQNSRDGMDILTLLKKSVQQQQTHSFSSSSHPTPPLPGWLINLRTLLPPPTTHTNQVRDTSAATEDQRSDEEGAEKSDVNKKKNPGGVLKRKRTSEILREARSLLFGSQTGNTGISSDALATRPGRGEK